MRNDSHAKLDRANYEASDETAPYVPPRPRPPQGDAPMYTPDPDTSMDDQITGPPPPPPPSQPPSNGYGAMLRGGTSTAQGLTAEGVQPAQPPPPLPSMLNPQPPPPPPPPSAGMVGAMTYPATAAQAFAPGGYGGGGPPVPPPSGARQTVQNLAHTAGHSFASSAGNAAGRPLVQQQSEHSSQELGAGLLWDSLRVQQDC